MNEYARWAEEYKKSAEITKEKIDELERRRSRSRSVAEQDEISGKLLTLYEMYGDCILSYRELMKKALRVQEGTTWN